MSYTKLSTDIRIYFFILQLIAICENLNCNKGQCIVSENGEANCICDSGYFGPNCNESKSDWMQIESLM